MASKKLQKQVAYWKEKGIIAEKEATGILADPHEAQLVLASNTYAILAVIGAIIAGLGIIMILQSNWDSIGRIAKTGVALFALIAFYASGYYFMFKKDMRKTGGALFAIGAVLFGANIFLIAQTYNFQDNFSIGFLIWFLGILPLVYLIKSRVVAVLSVLTSIAFVGFYFFPNDYGEKVVFLILLVAALWYSISLLHERFNNTAFASTPYGITSLAVWTVPILFLTSNFQEFTIPISKTMLAAIIILLVTSLIIIWKDWTSKKINQLTFMPFVLTTMSILAIIFSTKMKHSYDKITPGYVIINFILFFGLLYGIISSNKERSPLSAYAFSVIMGFFILARYFELSGIFFAGGFGLVLLGGGILLILLGSGLEAQRRRFKNA